MGIAGKVALFTGTGQGITVDRTHQRPLHPLHAILLAGTVPLFLGVLLSDIAYAASYEVQWKNFASWLIVGGLVFGGFALRWFTPRMPGRACQRASSCPRPLPRSRSRPRDSASPPFAREG
jgi:hypothetical protein